MFKIRVLLIPAVILSFLACSSTKSEIEPNNSRWAAQQIRPGDVIKGSISSVSDNDCFSIVVPDRRWFNTSLFIELQHPSLVDLMLIIYKDDKIIKIIDGFASSEERGGKKPRPTSANVKEVFANLPLLPGKYVFILKKTPGGMGALPVDYKFSLKKSSRSDFSELEPNDSRKIANSIEIDSSVEGYISPGLNPLVRNRIEEDWYKLNIQVSNKSFLDVEVSGVPGVDLVLSIFDSNGKLLKEADSHQEHTGEKIKRLGILSTNIVYIKVAPKTIFSFNNTIPYTLVTSITRYTEGNELEPNDSVKTSNPVSINKDVTGFLTPVNDKDYFKVTIPQSGRYMIRARVKGVTDVDIGIAVYNSFGSLLKKYNSGKKGDPEFISNLGIVTKENDEVFYIKVYSIDGQSEREEYTLNVSFFEYNSAGEFEPNDSIGAATPVVFDSSTGKKTGFISPRGDADFYSFTISENRNISIKVSGVPAIDLLLKIYNDKRKSIRSSDGAGLHEGEYLSTDLKGPATYYLMLKAKKKDQSNSRNPYTIQINDSKPKTLPEGRYQSTNTNTGTNIKPKDIKESN